MSIPNDDPREIISAPLEAWLADVATAFPLPDADPSADWTLIGTNGAHNYGDSGVTIEAPQTMQLYRGLKSPAPIKAFRTEEGLHISFEIADMTLEGWKAALNGNSVTTVAAGAAAGYKSIQLYRGLSVTQYALLLRGPSPYLGDAAAQFQIPKVVFDGSPKPVATRDGKPMMLAYSFQALADLSQDSEGDWFGSLLAVNAVATS